MTWLVIGYSVSGILAFLLVHPLLDDADNPWVRLLSKWYFPALIPLSILQLLAVWERISAYGVTENRYLALTTGFWLLLAIGIMVRTHSVGSVAGIIADTTLTRIRTDSLRQWDAAQHIVNTLGLDRIQPGGKSRFLQALQPEEAVPTRGYAFLARARIDTGGETSVIRVVGADTLRYVPDPTALVYGGQTVLLDDSIREWSRMEALSADRATLRIGAISVTFVSIRTDGERLATADLVILHN